MAMNPGFELQALNEAGNAAGALRGARAWRLRRNRRFRNRRQAGCYWALSLPICTAILQVLLGLWMFFFFIYFKLDCDGKSTIVEIPNSTTVIPIENATWIDIDITNDTATVTDVGCSNLKKHYSTQPVILLSGLMILAGSFRLLMMANVRRIIEENMRRNWGPKRIRGYILLNGVLILAVVIPTGMVYNPWRQEEKPLNFVDKFFDLRHHLFILFYFCIVDAALTLLPLIFVEFCKLFYLDPIPEIRIELADDVHDADADRRRRILETIGL